MQAWTRGVPTTWAAFLGSTDMPIDQMKLFGTLQKAFAKQKSGSLRSRFYRQQYKLLATDSPANRYLKVSSKSFRSVSFRLTFNQVLLKGY
jgi:hypothetical protein